MSWILYWLSYSGLESGPLFQQYSVENDTFSRQCLPEAHWTTMTDFLFKRTGLYTPRNQSKGIKKKGCTIHAIRRTACQWAGRCKGSPLDAKNTGRWKTFDEMARYHAQGMQAAGEYTNGAVDPIFKMWLWKPTSVAGWDGQDQL